MNNECTRISFLLISFLTFLYEGKVDERIIIMRTFEEKWTLGRVKEGRTTSVASKAGKVSLTVSSTSAFNRCCTDDNRVYVHTGLNIKS